MTREEIKEFVLFVYEEIKRGNYEFMKYIDTEFNVVVSLGEYFKSKTFKENLSLQKINNLPEEAFTVIYKRPGGAYFEKSAKTFVYANHYQLPIDNRINKLGLTLIVFHELRHALQDQNKNNTFASIAYQMEEKKSGLTYLITHDDWFMELDADIAAIEGTLAFIADHVELYDKNEIAFLKRYYREKRYFLKNFDCDKLFSNYCAYKLKHPEYATDLEWERLLFDEKGNIRSLDDILNDENFSRVDESFIKLFITSEAFVKSCDMNKLSADSLDYLYQANKSLRDAEEENYMDLSGRHYARRSVKVRDRLNGYMKKSIERIDRYDENIKDIEKTIKNNSKVIKRSKTLGYISVLSMTIGILILLCIFMIYIILQR